MIISRQYGRKLVREGKAWISGYMAENRELGLYYAILNRKDIGRTDHYYVPANSKEYRISMSH